MEAGVIETGLGGARDATNVFGDQLQLAIITAVGTEHSAALGACRLEATPDVQKVITAGNAVASDEQAVYAMTQCTSFSPGRPSC